MSHPSYAKGYRFEKRVQAWLVHLGRCIRSLGSKGSDLKVLRGLRVWTFSCKKRQRGKGITIREIKAECEKYDFCIEAEDRDVPWFHGPLPKVVEFARAELGEAEAEDVDLLFNEDAA